MLTPIERLEQAENEVSQGFELMARALKRIKDEQLYRAREDCKTFAQWCNTYWDKHERTAHYWIDAVRILDQAHRADPSIELSSYTITRPLAQLADPDLEGMALGIAWTFHRLTDHPLNERLGQLVVDQMTDLRETGTVFYDDLGLPVVDGMSGQQLHHHMANKLLAEAERKRLSRANHLRQGIKETRTLSKGELMDLLPDEIELTIYDTGVHLVKFIVPHSDD